MNLATAAGLTPMWGTPSVADVDGGRMHRSGARSTELLLKGQALRLTETWATPTARDHRSIHASAATRARNSRPLSEQVGDFCSRQGPPTMTDGGNFSLVNRTLNPLFVEAVMGWPIGWTGFVFAETEWCRWLRRMRCELLRLSWRSPAGHRTTDFGDVDRVNGG
ncbi:MAG: hypothetical protein ACRET2_00580 [Steroidobacteraceae bacterium]